MAELKRVMAKKGKQIQLESTVTTVTIVVASKC